MSKYGYVSPKLFGKDHWSMLAYVETLCVDSTKQGIGEIDKRRIRLKHRDGWMPAYGTRLYGFFDKPDARLQLPDHDDMDCLDDMENAGYVEVLSGVNGFVRMTKDGMAVAAQLREHKADGGMFATFRPWKTAAA